MCLRVRKSSAGSQELWTLKVVSLTLALIDFSQKIPASDFSIDMVSIEGGDFIIGNYNDNVKTKISPFWISKYEITWEIFNLFMQHQKIENKEFKIADKINYVDGVSKPTEPYTDMTFGMG